MRAKNYIFAGGGSGGHLFPGIAVAEELRRRDPDIGIHFVGSERPVERRILDATPFTHHALPVEQLAALRKSPLRFLQRNWSAWQHANRILAEQQPCWVIGLGGYISAPTVWAASRRGIPILLLEQNAVPGAATRWLSSTASHIALTFADARQHLRRNALTIVTGNPLRADVLAAAEQRTSLDAQSESRTLLILGGSQGAESLNQAIITLLPMLREQLAGWQIVHQTGASRSQAIHVAYHRHQISATVADFFPDIAARYADVDLVISRSGATTLAELACIGCPAILVPYPFAADQHQRANAAAFARENAAVMVEHVQDAFETSKRLLGPLSALLTDANRRAAMGNAMRSLAMPSAAEQIADLLSRDSAEQITNARGGRKPPPRKHKELVS